MRGDISVVFTSQNLQFPPFGGPQLRVVNILKALVEVANVRVLIRRDQNPSITVDTLTWLTQIGVHYDFQSQGGRLSRQAKEIIPHRLSELCAVVRETGLRNLARDLVGTLTGSQVSVIWVGYAGISAPLVKHLRKLAPNLRIVADNDSVYSEFLLRTANHQHGIRRLLTRGVGLIRRSEERMIAKKANVVTSVSSRDRLTLLRNGCGNEKLFLLVNGIDLDSYKDHHEQTNLSNTFSGEILIVGTFGNKSSPMNQAVIWFIQYVLPLLHQRGGYPRINIVGKNSDKLHSLTNAPNVTFWGEVPSTIPFFRQSRMMVVPLHFEAGTRLKILEAGAFRLPVVSTSLGAEGLELTSGTHYLSADSDIEMANNIMTLLSDDVLASRLGGALHGHVVNNFSLTVLVKQIRAIIDYLRI